MADDISKLSEQAQKNAEEALKLQDLYAQRAKSGTLEQMAGFAKIAEMQKQFAEQNQEYLKALEEIRKGEQRRIDILKKQEALKKQGAKEDDERLKKLDEELKAEEELHRKRTQSTLEIKKKTEEQKKSIELLTKEKGLMGEIAAALKNKMLQQLAAVMTLGNALRQLGKLQKDALDIAVLSGNYKILDQSYGGLAKSAAIFEKNMKEARIGLRFLGYDAAEIDQSFKEFSTSLAMTGVPLDQVADKAAVVTETTGRLARMLGVTLSEATAYSTEMTQRFNQTSGQTAEALMNIYKATDRYNQAAGKQVLIARDITKVMFDLARETKGATVEQDYLSKKLTANVLMLQSQGKTYRESLQQASLYMKKMTTEAPDWAKIMGGRELESQMQGLAGKGGDALRKKLEEVSPGLSSRVEDIMTNVKDKFTRERLLQELLEGTSFGMQAMEKEVGSLIDRMGDKAAIALAQMHGISVTEAQSMVDQVKSARELEASKKRMASLDLLAGEAREKELEALAKQTGLSKEKVDQLAQIKDGTQEQALSLELQLAQEQKALKAIKDKEDFQKERRNKQIQDYEKLMTLAMERGDTKTAESFRQKMEALKGPEKVNSELEEKMATIQGGTTGEGLSMIYEALTSATGQLGAIATILGGQTIIQALIAFNTSPLGKIKDGIVDLFKKGGGAAKTAGTAVKGGAGNVLRGAATVGRTVLGSAAVKLAAAAGAGYVAGNAINRGAESLTTEENQYGQRSNAIERGMAKVLPKFLGGMSAEEYKDTYVTGYKDVSREDLDKGYTRNQLTGLYEKNRLAETPVSALPTETDASQGGRNANLPQGFSTPGAANNPSGAAIANATAGIIPGAQGADIEVNFGKVRLPIAQVLGMNLDIMKMGVRNPTGGS